MILVSCRRRFDSDQLFARENIIRDIPALNDLNTFTPLTETQLQGIVAGGRVLVLVHGFRNPVENVARSYGELQTGLTANGLLGGDGYTHVMGFLWPGFATPAGFFPAVPWANRSASYFRSLLRTLATAGATVDVETHSLGARVVLQAIAFPGEAPFRDLLLTAAAVDDECLEPAKEFNATLGSLRRCVVYHSTHDNTLRFAYRIGGLDKALGFKGPQDPAVIAVSCPNVFVVDASAPVRSHGGYRRSQHFFDHWQRVVGGEALERFEVLGPEPA